MRKSKKWKTGRRPAGVRRQAWTLAFLFGLVVTLTAGAQTAPQVLPGDGPEAVIQAYGWPHGKGAAGPRELWSYDGFTVTFENDHVVRVMGQPTAPGRAYRTPPPFNAPAVRATPPTQLGSAVRPTGVTVAPGATSLALSPSRGPAAPPRSNAPTLLAPTQRPMAHTFVPPAASPVQADSLFSGALWMVLPIAVVVALAIAALVKQRRTELRFNRSVQPAPPPKSPATWQQTVSQRLQQLHGTASVTGQEPPVLSPPAGHVNWRDLDSAHQASPAEPDIPATLTLERLRELEWKRFELIVTRYFGASGFRAEPTCIGADGGIDVKLYGTDESAPFALVQCKAWEGKVGVKPVRELFGVMASEQVNEGYFVATSSFQDTAISWAAGKKLHLIDGTEFVTRFNALPEADRTEILAQVFAGDYRTPSCPNCDVKLVVRTNEGDQSSFWGCPRYPRCRYKLNSASAAEAA